MTEDPREFGLTAADLRTVADRLYPPADSRLDRAEGTWSEAARWGRIRSRLRSLADAIDPAVAIWASRDDTKPDADARRASNVAMEAIDAMLAELHQLRARLVGEIRISDDQAARRADELLARCKEEPR